MKKILLVLGLLISTSVVAGSSTVQNAKIVSVEFYGSQFTVYFDKPHTSKGCGHPGDVVAMDTSFEPGKAHYSFFLMAYSANKSVSVTVTDTNCSGDRPTISKIVGH
ncbi:hypothetical protein [Aliikangiella sp. IMCC44359]|uniref:hypothetical protein n=1 Tax=Aliikangiella sp. IMCC44359 TaxID=3459125 RepID=UPI00403B0A5B